MKLKSTGLLLILLSFVSFTGCFEEVTNIDDEKDDINDTDPINDFNHTLTPGESNKAFLTNQDFDSLVVEVQFMSGVEPEQEALDSLEKFLNKHLQKREIIIAEPVEIGSGERTTYSISEIRDIEQNERRIFTEEGRLAAYILFLDGTFLGEQFENPTRLGISQYNTSTAFFGSTINRISGPLQFEPDNWNVEATSLRHQFGHLIGLVNNGTEMIEHHHDEANGPHCSVESCLMHFRINTTDYFDSHPAAEIPLLDSFCLTDIEAVRN